MLQTMKKRNQCDYSCFLLFYEYFEEITVLVIE